VWIADTLAQEASRQWTDPDTVSAELEQVHDDWVGGRLSDRERDEAEDALLQRLMAGRSQGQRRG
jgi:hypothetical protein